MAKALPTHGKAVPSAVGGTYLRRLHPQQLTLGNNTTDAHRVSVTSTTALQLSGNMTLEFVFTPRNLGAARLNPVGKAYAGEGMLTIETTGAITYYQGNLGTNSGTSGTNYEQFTLFTNNLANNTRYHVAVVRRTSDKRILTYLNGVLDKTMTYTVDPVAGTLPWTFFNNYASTYVTDCDMEYVRLWNTVRTEAQIRDFKDLELEATSGLVGQWVFDGSLADSSGNSHNGALANGATATYKLSPAGSATWYKRYEGSLARMDLYTGVGIEPTDTANKASALVDTDASGIADGYTVGGWSNTDDTATVTSTFASGEQTIAITSHAAGANTVLEDYNVSFASPLIAAAEGDVFTAQIEISVDATAGREFQPTIEFYNNGTRLSAEYFTRTSDLVANTFVNSTVATSNPAPAGTTHVKYVYIFRGGANVASTVKYRNPTHKRRALNGGKLKVEVAVRNSGGIWLSDASATKELATYLAQDEAFFYDDLTRTDGTNAAVFTAFQDTFDEYQITLTPAGIDASDTGATTCVYRLNGWAVFEHDPLATPLPQNLSTLDNVLELQPESNERDRRNHVTVVGARKATVTDSEKYLKKQNAQNPNNFLPEHHISVSADPQSIYNPSSDRYAGGKRATVIIDDKVADGEFARWLSKLVLYRQLNPRLSGDVKHTAIPVLEIRDAIRVVDEVGGHYPHLLWVNGFTETWELDSAVVTLECSSYSELPSYTPREDVNLDLFGGRPVYDVSVTYKNLYGQTVTNADLVHTLTLPKPTRTSVAATDLGQALPAYAITDGIFYGRAGTPPYTESSKPTRMLVNHPYRHFYDVTWSGATPTVTSNFQEGDGTADVYTKSFYSYPTSWNLSYDTFTARTGTNPFYDPYTSEVGNLVSLKFDSLVSGLYRISVWAKSDAGEFDLPVAWLTDPESDPSDPEAHWSYFEAAINNELLWDGSDTIGAYNRYQSQEYAQRQQGNFGESPLAVGLGHYVWNMASTDANTQIGDARVENIDYDEDGNVRGLCFTTGKYAKFYVRIEAKADQVLRSSGDATPLEFNTAPKTTSNPDGMDPDDSEVGYYIWTHLGEPTQAHIQAWEWTGGAWTEATSPTDAAWVLAADSIDALIRANKPVKFTFKPVVRRGFLFRKSGQTQADRALWSGQLHRLVHLKATVFDSFLTFFGRDWQDVKGEYRGIEEKRLTTRMYHNEDHTLDFTDEQPKDGDELVNLYWIFTPDQFEKDFGTGQEEVLRYGDYEQLETIPGHDPKRLGGTSREDRSHFLYGYLNYLFYFSAYVQDRSGRKQWCINPRFVDKSKIVTSAVRGAAYGDATYSARYERLGADEYLLRSIFVRQWLEPGWKDGTLAGNPITAQSITDAYQLKFVQPGIKDFDIYTGALRDTEATPNANNLAPWLQAYGDATSNASKDVQKSLPQVVHSAPIASVGNYHQALPALGNWDFVRGGYSLLYKPTPGIDFHPYWNKFMPDYNNRFTYTWATLDVLSGTGSCRYRSFRDVTAQDTWYGWSESYTHMTNQGANGYLTDAGARVEDTAQKFLSTVGGRGTQAQEMFDMQRIDTLDRFDQFRGVISRGEFKDRDEADAAFWDKDRDRIAPAQPVKPSGVYLLNVGKYDDYIVGPIHKYRSGATKHEPPIIIHSTERIQEWFDIRFHHEYLWYSERYFPIWESGASAYHRFRGELTRTQADSTFNTDLNTNALYYDGGAWTGWKGDRTSAEWTADPFLRWVEWYGKHSLRGTTYDGSSSRPASSGGYDSFRNTTAYLATGTATASRRYQSNGDNTGDDAAKTFRRENIFEGPNQESTAYHRMRLAVGPEVPEARRLTMNLVLPTRLT